MHYRTALVTGASSGIGRALARALAATGTHVVLAARRERELDDAVAEIARAGGRATARVLDVSDAEATVRAVRAIDDAVEGLELVVANAGVGGTLPPRPLAWEDVAPMLRVNFDGAIATLTAVLPRMHARGRGHLVGISSLASFGPLPRSAGYCASKAGLSMFLASLRLDLLDSPVKVTAVHPGFVRTPLSATNRFIMPFLMDADAAASRIARLLPRAPATIDFPLPMTLAARAGAGLPRPLRDLAARRRWIRDD
jgi:short-subunit dehydrogenase